MKNNRRKQTIRIIRLAACALVSLCICSKYTYAAGGDAWIGGPGGSTTPGGGGGASCSDSTAYAQMDCFGWSWIFYQYVGGDAYKDYGVIKFTPTITKLNSTDNWYQIGTDEKNCAKLDGGTTGKVGFWHLGRNGRGSRDKYSSAIDDYFGFALGYADYSFNNYIERGKNSEWRYDIGWDRLGHSDTFSVGSLPDWAPEKVPGDSIKGTSKTVPEVVEWDPEGSHTIYRKINGTYRAMDRATEWSRSNGQAWTDMTKAWKRAYKEDYPDSRGTWPNIPAFCYGDGIDKHNKAYFTASTSVSGGGVLPPSASGSYTITFTHTIERTSGEDSENYEVSNNYQTNSGEKGIFTSSQVGAKKTVTHQYTGTLQPGESIMKCDWINYGTFYEDVTEKGRDNSAQKCATVSRPTSGYYGQINASVTKNGGTSVTVSPGSTITLDNNTDNGQYSISFSDIVYRANGDKTYKNGKEIPSDKAGGAVETYYTVWATDAGYAVRNAATNKLSPGGSQTVYTKTYTGTLRYGEEVEKCNYLWYVPVQITNKNANTPAINSPYCVKIKRPKKDCSIDSNMKYGYKDGENIGRVGVMNRSASNIFSFTSYSLQNNLISNEADVNTWAKPGDDIQFKHLACAGAFYVIESNPAIGSGSGTHYATEGKIVRDTNQTTRNNSANSDGYLFKNDVTVSPYKNPTNTSGADLTRISNSTPKPYATWTTGPSGNQKPSSGFLSSWSQAEMSLTSPSNGNYNGSSNSYRVCRTTSDGCKFGQQDVGGKISQTLSWNHFKFTNGSNNANASDYKTYFATASVSVPYNYALIPYVKNDLSKGVVYLGEKLSMQPGVLVRARTNNYVKNKSGTAQTYSTITKVTSIKVRVYNKTQGKDILTKSYSTRLNKDGDLNVKIQDYASFGGATNDIVAPIYDFSYNHVGDKICVEVSVTPSDSHNTNNWNAVYGAKADTGVNSTQWGLMESGTSTATRESCSTVAKRPTMSVESSNAYSATTKDNKAGFTTSLYTKTFGANGSGNEYIFGSWSEYGVFGRVNLTKHFVSGAAIAYKTTAINTSTRLNEVRANNDTSSLASGSVAGKTCTFMTQTFVNSVGTKCDTSSTIIGKSAADNFQKSILDRYGKSSYGVTHSDNTTFSASMAISSNRAEKDDKESNVAVRVNGNAALSGTPTITDGNRTIVYNIGGTLRITGNINDERDSTKTNLSDLTGVIIVAKNVWISSNVTYINATIVTRDGGEVNTCKYNGSTAIVAGTNLSADVCNSTLIFDAPVFTQRIILNRTAGADADVSSIRRAEIFNLNMANYLWSFNQMTHYSQAVTTYSRELPTRY